MKLDNIYWRDDKTFGEYLNFNMPFGCDMVVICVNTKSGHKAVNISLPHQATRDILKRLLKDHNGDSITIIPYKNSDKFTIDVGDILGETGATNF